MPQDTVRPRRPTRRDVLRILALGAGAAAAWKLGAMRAARTASVTRTESLMGTVVHLTVHGDDREAAEAAVEATLRRMSGLEAVLSRYRPDSEVSLLNTTGRVDEASDGLLDVLQLADRISRLGDGAFDVTIQPVVELYDDRLARHGELPPAAEVERAVARVDHRALRIDGRTVTRDDTGTVVTLDGIGKGYVVDRGVAELKQRGFPNVFVEAGGDLVAAGAKGSDEPWRVGIKNPRPGMQLLARFDTQDRAVATSGDYMQPFTQDFAQHHILDPRTGYSAPELASATVIAPDGATADALATLAMVLGTRRCVELLEGLPGCEGYLVSKDLETTRTSGFTLV